MFSKIKSIQQVMEGKTTSTNTMLGVYREQINYYSSVVTKQIEGGFETDFDTINLGRWWGVTDYYIEKQIFFKKDYSSRPFVFFTANMISGLVLADKNRINANTASNNIMIDILFGKVMTSYFTVRIYVKSYIIINDEEIDQNTDPRVIIQYVAFSRV